MYLKQVGITNLRDSHSIFQVVVILVQVRRDYTRSAAIIDQPSKALAKELQGHFEEQVG